ncbi:MAG: tyrosine-type recombinase/integrase [Bacteroidia bacterium]
MKHLVLTSTHYRYLEKSYTEWLNTLGYAETTTSSLPIHVREFLHFLEKQNIKHITQVQPRVLYQFVDYISQRKHRKQNQLLSHYSINKIITAVNSFAVYLNKSGNHLIDVHGKRLSIEEVEKQILTTDEIKQLYEATYESNTHNSNATGQRDRAMIALFYGCGIRRKEGMQLNIQDIDTVKAVVFIKKGKGNKQRYVPIATKHLEDIKEYLEEGRTVFLKDNTNWHIKRQSIKKKHRDDEAFFINQFGKRMIDFYHRIKVLKARTGISKPIGLHTLRHSIATHLLQNKMPIEDISKFLGHASLESTQIYTHIVEELEK